MYLKSWKLFSDGLNSTQIGVAMLPEVGPAKERDEFVLLVRHGPNRGPHIRLRRWRPAYLQPMLDDLQRRDPDLRSRLCVWETGTPLPDWRGARAILFLLSDPLQELYPECYREAARLAQDAEGCGIRIINSPSSLSHSIKSTQSRLWREAGLPTPRHLPFTNRQQLEAAIEEIGFPAIVRADWEHTQAGMHLLRDRHEFEKVDFHQLHLPGSVAEFIDSREGFRSIAPGTVWANYYHKKRAFVFGDGVRSNHLFFAHHPIVSSKTCTFGHYRSWNPVRRWQGNRACREHLALDRDYFLAEQEHAPELVRAARTLGLEFVAIDYSSTASGGIVLWESNPHFSLHLWPFNVLERHRDLSQRFRTFHDSMGRYFRDLLEQVP